jgi:hypothetical protein
MTKRLRLSIAVLVILIALYVVVMRVAPPPRSSMAQNAAREGPPSALNPGPYPTEYDEVTVTIEIAPLSEFPRAWATHGGCPHKVLMGVLGAVTGPANGCPVLAVEPDGAAAKAGIQRLDRLGKPEDCASSIQWDFRPWNEPRTVEWTLRRPKSATSGGGPASQDPDES